MLSAPRAGKAAGQGRGRGKRSRSNSPLPEATGNQTVTAFNAKRGHLNGTSRGRGNTSQSIAPSRGRGAATWIRGASRGSLRPQFTSKTLSNDATHQRKAEFDFTGDRAWRAPENAARKDYKSKIQSFWETLKRNRVAERQREIAEGKISDPDKKVKLSEAIKPVGICEEMCPEWERISRIHDGNILWPEKVQLDSGERVPSEENMVKRFQRSAAGDDAQLPSDLRPPRVLQKTLQYMIDKILNGADPIERVQEFLWDRSRAIRNDFSIQQVTNLEDVSIAIECFERIARYHILAIHQTSHSGHKPGVEHKQENEQLTNTLTSLFHYYDDNHGKIMCKNEPEFRAYYIIREIYQERRPDLESRVQQWPPWVIKHPRVRTALRLYAAAGDMTSALGPLDPKQAVAIAQANSAKFWSVVNSSAVPYLMACCAESYFRIVRDTALTTIWKSCKRPAKTKLDDLLLSDITDTLGFDNEDQAQAYCEHQGFTIAEREDGNAFLDLTSIPASQIYLPGSDGAANQLYSERLVEDKRHGRLSAAIVMGLSVLQARAEGLLDESDHMQMEADTNSDPSKVVIGTQQHDGLSQGKPQQVNTGKPGLFFQKPSSEAQANSTQPNPFANPFAKPSQLSQVPSNEVSKQPDLFNFTSGASAGPSNPFAKAISASVASSSPNQPPISNEQIAANTFATPSHSLTPTKLDTVGKTSEGVNVSQNSSLFGSAAAKNPFASTSWKAEGGESVSQPDQKPSEPLWATSDKSAMEPAGSVLQKPSMPGSGLGTSLFANNYQNKSQGSNAASSKPNEVSALKAQAPRPESPSLFVPNTASIPDKDKTSQLQSVSTLFAQQDAQPSNAGQRGLPNDIFTNVGNPKHKDANKAPALDPGLTHPTFAAATKASTPSVDLSATVSVFPNQQPPSASLFLQPQSSNPFAPAGANAGPSNEPTINLPGEPRDAAGKKLLFPVSESQPAKTIPSAHTGAPNLPAKGIFTSSTVPSVNENERPATSGLEATLERAQTQAPASLQRKPAEQSPTATAARQRISDAEYVNKLIHTFALGANGMIRQFVESEIGETVRVCIKKVNREREKEEVELARKFLLSGKYVRRWRDIAWKKKLRRDAKQRRQDFRKSMQGMALSSRSSSRATSEAHVGASRNATETSTTDQKGSMGPPKSILKNGLDSLRQHQAVNTAEDLHAFSERLYKSESKPATKPLQRINHRHSALSAINFGKVSKSSTRRRLLSSMVGDVGLQNEQLMRKASRLLDGRTDTTRTDYFKLKSLGLDPNTPIIPQTRKRRSDEEIEAEVRKSRYSPVKVMSSSVKQALVPDVVSTPARNSRMASSELNIPKASKSNDDDDDALFAQIKAVKDALSETESWYREYREQSERTSVEIANETEKQKRLREWKPSVSRTEARWRREGLPSFLRSSWTPRETVSTERSVSRQANHKGSNVSERRDVKIEDEDEDESVEEDNMEDHNQAEYAEGEGEEDYEEEDYDEANDTQAFEMYQDENYVNPKSEFATQGASAEDAIEL